MINIYHINNSVRVKATFTLGGVKTDPTTITLKIIDPTGSLLTYTYALGEIQKEDTGIYYKEIVSDKVGDWHYMFTSTGAVVAADESYYTIEHSVFE